jgi:hypothetical protein
MYILFALTENENFEDVVRRPVGIYEFVEDGFKWIRENYESYKDVFRDGEEQIYYENKDTKTFTTSSKEEMDAWVNEMVEELYEVTVTFDKKTGLYTGTATPPGGGSRTTMTLSRE